MGLREYETTLLVNPGVSPDVLRQFGERIKEIVASNGGSMLQLLNLGKLSTAYAVDDHNRAIYLFANFIAEGSVVAELTRWSRYEDMVLRQMTILVAESVGDLAKRQVESENDLRRFQQYCSGALPLSLEHTVGDQETTIEQPVATTA